MRAADIRPGVEYAVVRYKRDEPRRAVLEAKGQGGAYKLITRELVDGVGKDVEPRVEWAPAPHDTRSHTFRLVEPRTTYKRIGYGPDSGAVEYLAEFMAVRGQEILGPYDEVMAERERRAQASREAEERRRARARENAELTVALSERLDAMGLAEVFVIEPQTYEPPRLRCRSGVTAERALDALEGWRS